MKAKIEVEAVLDFLESMNELPKDVDIIIETLRWVLGDEDS